MLRAQGAAGAALAECAAALTLAQAASEPRLAALAAQRGSLLARQLGRFADAAALETQSLQALDDLAGEAWAARAAATVGGHVPLGRGDLAEAEQAFQEMIARQRLLGQEPGSTHPYACFALIGLGDVARGRAEAALALTRYQTGLRHAWRFGEMPPVAYALGGVAGALAALGRWSEAARLFGATEALCERTGLPFGPATMDRQRALGLPEPWLRAAEPVGLDEPLRTAVRARRGAAHPTLPDPDEAARQWAVGREMSAADAVAAALALETAAAAPLAATPPQTGMGAPARQPEDVAALTFREQEVLALLCQRLTDPEIAARLFISPKTAGHHVSNILGKLGVANRREAAAIAVRRGLV
jgi:DNA-binding CsgD family transcriptional regulator